MRIKTHKMASERLVGKALTVNAGFAEVQLRTLDEMAVDEYGLVHGGFTFGLADYAAMLAVNEPTVVLGKAEVKFLKPVKAGEILTAKAGIAEDLGKKKLVKVEVLNESDERVFEGTFHCYVLDRHVLEG
ncbi:PaaI family thioesterase [Thermococcus sp.]|uniref:PaaI family thioesterase n=1 Tax=Thermococcus sp. TaxID=35749 RepID=UPI0025CBC914|nr:PaaI family thioesterase [Thermococcus sp.]